MRIFTKNVFTTIILSAGLLLCTGMEHEIKAQSAHLTAWNMGLGGGGTAYQDLYHANFVNPANLMLNHDTRPKITIGIAGGIYSHAGGNLVNITVFNEYLTSGLVIEGEVRENMLNEWFGSDPSGMSSAAIDLGIVPIGVVYRGDDWAISFANRVRLAGKTGVSRGFADLIFRGLDSDYFQTETPVNSVNEYYAWNEWSVGYARLITERQSPFGFAGNMRIYAGVAPKLIFANDYTSIRFNSDLTVLGVTDQSGGEILHHFDYSLKTTGQRAARLEEYNRDRNAGLEPDLGDYLDPEASDFRGIRGFSLGLDMGVTAEMDLRSNRFFDLGIFRGDKTLTLALSLTDLGSLAFSDRARTFSNSGLLQWQGFDYDREIIDEQFDGDESAYFESVLRDSIGDEIYGDFSTINENRHSVALPSMVRMGAHLRLGRFGLAADAGTGLTTRGTNSRRFHLSLGSEYRFFNRVPLRAGIRTGGLNSTTYHAGTGVEFRNFEFSIGAASSASSRRGGAGIGMAWSGFVFHF
jgi:hypothetical protein